MHFPKVTLVGVGLLGGSLGLALKRRKLAGRVEGYVRRDASIAECESLGVVDRASRDLAAVGIRVNTVAPGLIDTPIYGQGDASEAFKQNLQKGVLFPQRLGFQEELASMVVECVTNSYMNAETIRVDGGIRMPPK